MAVIYSLSKGYDPWYPWEQMRRKGGDYFHVKGGREADGEPRGRWYGCGARPSGAHSLLALKRAWTSSGVTARSSPFSIMVGVIPPESQGL